MFKQNLLHACSTLQVLDDILLLHVNFYYLHNIRFTTLQWQYYFLLNYYFLHISICFAFNIAIIADC